MQLGLGTVQFGLAYGATNRDGLVDSETIANILAYAEGAGIRLLDTAAAYGSSEQALGVAGAAQRFRIVSKTLPIAAGSIGASDIAAVVARVRRSLELLRLPQLPALLVHHADNLLAEGGEQLFKALQGLQAEGLIERLGVSVYTLAQFDELVRRYPLQLIQLPGNILDQALLQHEGVHLAHQRGVEIHLRSAFLQGLLLQPALPTALHGLQRGFTEFQHLCKLQQVDQLVGALHCLRQFGVVDRVLVGVTSVQQLQDIDQAWQRAGQLPTLDYGDCDMAPNILLNPSNWPPREALLI